MKVYYGDFDPFCAAWLENLVRAGLLPAGVVDSRDVKEVGPDDVRGFDQCHFFAGTGGWALALLWAGWPEWLRVWTASLPCQPFSTQGKKRGFGDERHLWPVFRRLVRECRPPVILGEQVAGKAADRWIDVVFDDLEDAGYACGAAVLPAAAVGSPQFRMRYYWVAYSPCLVLEDRKGRQGRAPAPRKTASGSGVGRCDAWRNLVPAGRSTRGAAYLSEPGVRILADGFPSGVDTLCALCGSVLTGGQDPSCPSCGSPGKAVSPTPLMRKRARASLVCALGNAVVPQLAAAFASSFLSALPALPALPALQQLVEVAHRVEEDGVQ